MKKKNIEWSDIKLYQYKQIVEELKREEEPDDIDRALYLCAILFPEVDFSLDMKYKDLNKYYSQLTFLNTMPVTNKIVSKSYQLKKYNYKFNLNIGEISTAQYIDWANYNKLTPIDNLDKMLSVVLVPEGHSYNDGYDMQEVMDDINDNMSITDVLTITFFFQSWSTKFMETSLYYFNKQLKKTQKMKKQKLN